MTTTEPEPIPVSWTVANDPGLSHVVASGTATAEPDADGTVHVDVEGLEPATAYHYGFEALGQRSPIARTRTLPPSDTDHVRIAMVSCAKYAAGFFASTWGRSGRFAGAILASSPATRAGRARPVRRPA